MNSRTTRRFRQLFEALPQSVWDKVPDTFKPLQMGTGTRTEKQSGWFGNHVGDSSR